MGDDATIEALLRTVSEEFERYAKIKKNVPEEALTAIANSTEPDKLADLAAGHLGIEVADKQDCWKPDCQRPFGKNLWPDAGRNERSSGREKD